MKILREKIFGAIKRANKAKKRDLAISHGRKLALTKDLLSDIDRPLEYYNEKIPEDQLIRQSRQYERNGGLLGHKDKLEEKLREKAKNPEKFLEARKKQAKDAKEAREFQEMVLKRKKEAQRSEEAHRTLLQDIEKRAKSMESISKHKSQAKKLRDDNKLGVAVRDAKRWAKKNPGKASAVAAGTTALAGGLGYAAYKLHKNKENNKKEDKK